jgi:hypothetical protein
LKNEDLDTPLVLIEWLDSAQPIPGWQHLSDYESGKAGTFVSGVPRMPDRI